MRANSFKFKLNGLEHAGIPDIAAKQVSIIGPFMTGIFSEEDFQELYQILRQVFWQMPACECGARQTTCVCGKHENISHGN